MRAPRAFFEDNLERIDRISAAVCRRNGCRGADAEDFSSVVRVKLLEDDCGRLRKFRGRSKVTTFLTFVITNLFRDHRNHLWGKWRASTAARRLGETGILLERLTARDGRSIDEAVEILITNYRVEASRQELWAIWRQLPEKPTRRLVSVEEAPELAAKNGAGSRVEHSEEERGRSRLASALREAFHELVEEDRLLLRLCFEGALSVARIARALGENQRRLYYRKETAIRQLRDGLAARGVSAQAALRSIGWDGWTNGDSKVLSGSVYKGEIRQARQERCEIETRDPSRARNPRGVRRRQAAGS